MQNAPFRNPDGSWTINDIQKINRFAEHLKKTFQPNIEDELTNGISQTKMTQSLHQLLQRKCKGYKNKYRS